MFALHVTKEQADRIAASVRDPWQTVAILTEIANPKFVAEYLTQPIPRPAIDLILPANCSVIEFTVAVNQQPLRSSATYQIKGRGTVKICRIDKIPMPGPIEIDGESLICLGTEMQHPWKPGDEIGILVKPAPGRRIELGIDGRAAFALLGENIQSGECEFVDIEGEGVNAELIAAKLALLKLRERLGMPDALFYFGNSHPYGNG